MASIRRIPTSPYWQAVFRLPDGRQTNRSTRTIQRKDAQRIADQFEDAVKEATAGRWIEARARKFSADLYLLVNKEKLPGSSAHDYFHQWLTRKEIEADPATHQRYCGITGQFLEFLGHKANGDVSGVGQREVVGFRDQLISRLSPGTVNLSVKVLRVAFESAVRDGLIDSNPAKHVALVKKGKGTERRAFTMDELRSILGVCSDEWRGIVLFGLYTGQRLGDLASLTWHNVDLQKGELRLVTKKTERRQVIPLARPATTWLESQPGSDVPDSPLFPEAFAIVERTGRAGTLSNQFHDILVAAGLAKERTHESTGMGRSHKRQTSEISFHALRHTATSLLKNAGASDVIAREIIGHDSEAVSRRYSHIEIDALRRAVNQMPDVTGSR